MKTWSMFRHRLQPQVLHQIRNGGLLKARKIFGKMVQVQSGVNTPEIYPTPDDAFFPIWHLYIATYEFAKIQCTIIDRILWIKSSKQWKLCSIKC